MTILALRRLSLSRSIDSNGRLTSGHGFDERATIGLPDW
jgi:hypothetical protein